MRRLLTRLLRAERAVSTLQPRDPRKDLPPEEAARAQNLLEALGAEAPAPLAPEEAGWFERTIRPRLPAWIVYDRRQQRWNEGQHEARRVREKRHFHRVLGHPPTRSIFSAEELRALARLGLVAEAAGAAA
jgi:hypothetical protein